MLKLEHISKTFDAHTGHENQIFHHFDLEIKKGQFVVVIGSNGSGKSTLLNLICGSIEADEGKIWMEGKEIQEKSEYQRMKRIGRIHQDPTVGTSPSMSVLENLSMASNKGKKFGLKKGIQKKNVDIYKQLLKKFNMGLENKLDAKVCELSGGQRQALALAMVTMTPMDLFILDEHTAALDPKLSEHMMKMTNDIIQNKKLTTFMITHQLKDALIYGNRLIMLHQGKIILDVCGKEKENLNEQQLKEKFIEATL